MWLLHSTTDKLAMTISLLFFAILKCSCFNEPSHKCTYFYTKFLFIKNVVDCTSTFSKWYHALHTECDIATPNLCTVMDIHIYSYTFIYIT